MKQINKAKGFTLIELIIVIIILGVLAVTAAPKFLDVGTEAKTSTIQGMQGALQAATQLVRSKSRIDGNDGQEFDASTTPTITLDGSTIEVDEGFPAPTRANMLDIVDASSGDWIAVDDNATEHSATVARIYPVDNAGDLTGGVPDSPNTVDNGGSAQNCYVEYSYNSATDNRPSITIVSTEC